MRKICTIFLLTLALLAFVSRSWAADYSENVEGKAVKKVAPIYPPLAKVRRIQGKVNIGVQVNSEGKVIEVEFLEGNVLFKPASLEAARQWVFSQSSSGMTGHIVFKFYLDKE
ncbi:MAG: TonB family protein [Acidobacteriota bacterium]